MAEGPRRRRNMGSRGEREGYIVIRARVRRLAATVTIGSLLAIQALAGSAAAATPDATAESEAIPATYSDGDAAGFRGFFLFTDPSTLSKLFLRIDVDPALADNVFFAVEKNGAAVPGNACSVVEEDVVCSFKTVRQGDRFTARAGYLPLQEDQTQVTATFVWNSTGVPQNDDQSHGDDWDAIPRTAFLDNDEVNYGGGFTYDGDTTVGNDPIGPGNIQAARLVGLPVGIAATVEDGLTTGPCQDTAEVDCSSVSGEWVEAFVGDGLIYPVFKLEITYESGIPKGFVHTFVNAAGETVQEFIGPCAKKNPSFPCFTWSNQTNTATIFTTHNGSYIKIR
jgi:hypothetical protein